MVYTLVYSLVYSPNYSEVARKRRPLEITKGLVMVVVNSEAITKQMYEDSLVPDWLVKAMHHFFAVFSGVGNGFFIFRMLDMAAPVPAFDWYFFYFNVWLVVGMVLGVAFSYVMILRHEQVLTEKYKAGQTEIGILQGYGIDFGVGIIRLMNILGTALLFYSAIDYAEQSRQALEASVMADSTAIAENKVFDDSLKSMIVGDLATFKDRTIISAGYMPALESLIAFERDSRQSADSLRQAIQQARNGTVVVNSLALFDDVSARLGINRLFLALCLVCLVPAAIDTGLTAITQHLTARKYYALSIALANSMKSQAKPAPFELPANGAAADAGGASMVPAKNVAKINWEDPVVQKIVHLAVVKNMSYRDISKEVDKSHTHVGRIVKAYKESLQ